MVLTLSVGLAIALGSCKEDEPIDIDLTGMMFVAECDPSAAIHFDTSEKASVNANQCEGYASETWEYTLDGDVLTMAPDGTLGEPLSFPDTFRVAEDASTLTFTGNQSAISCSNCVAGDQWVRQ
jgi:hypothetical protein